MKIRHGIAATFLLGAGLAACATAPVTEANKTGPADDDPVATELSEHHQHHHHGGVTLFIAMSLDTLGADEAKRPKIEKLQSDLRASMAPAREAEKGLFNTLADGV